MRTITVIDTQTNKKISLDVSSEVKTWKDLETKVEDTLGDVSGMRALFKVGDTRTELDRSTVLPEGDNAKVFLFVKNSKAGRDPSINEVIRDLDEEIQRVDEHFNTLMKIFLK